jgi:hypothetical protein
MDGLTKKARAKLAKSAYLFDLADCDANARFLVGWPGYRTSRNKSGLGYVETQAELAHMQGRFIRWLITGKFKTRNPIYLFCITIYGLMSVSPLLLLWAGDQGRLSLIRNWQFFVPNIFLGVLFLVNVLLSLFKYKKGESITGD